jgi:hypothetical protein
MAAINRRRVWLGTLVGGIVWNAWSLLIGVTILFPRYPEAQAAGHYLQEPRYSSYVIVWILTLFALSYVVSLLYASSRATCGAGAKTALIIGVMVGFAASFPSNLGAATWSPVDRIFPLWHMIDLWGGAVLATLASAWLYKD